MMLSSKVIPRQNAAESTISFIPPIIIEDAHASQVAQNFDNSDSAFVLDQTQEVISGIDKIHKGRIDALVQHAVLQKFREVQEEAYKKGFELGREEGRVEAIKGTADKISADLLAIKALIENMQSQYEQVAKLNEGRLMDLIFKIASRLAAKTLEFDKSAIASVVKETIGAISNQDRVILEISPSLIEFFLEIQARGGRDFEFLKGVNIQPNELIEPGGCLVRTEFGQIDAQFETRLNNLWSSLKLAIPQVS